MSLLCRLTAFEAALRDSTSLRIKIKFYELFSGFSEVKMSIKIDVSISFTGLLQVVKNCFSIMADRFLDFNLVTAHAVS